MENKAGDQLLCLSMKSGLDTLFEIVCNKLCQESVLIEIAGGSCSGKTHLTNELEDLLKQKETRVSKFVLDNYFKDIDDPTVCRKGRIDFDWTGAYHGNEFREHIAMSVTGEDVMGPEYDIDSNRRKEQPKPIEASGIVIAEGLFVIEMLKGIRKSPIRVFIDTDEEVRLERIAERNAARYGIPKRQIEAVFYGRINPNHKMFVEPQRLIADIVIRNNRRYKK